MLVIIIIIILLIWKCSSASSITIFLCLSSSIYAQSLSHVQLFVTLWTVLHQAAQSMRFSQQEYWNGLPRPPLGDLSDPSLLHCRQIFYHQATGEKFFHILSFFFFLSWIFCSVRCPGCMLIFRTEFPFRLSSVSICTNWLKRVKHVGF